MSQIAQQQLTPVVVDLGNVDETYCNGPINFGVYGPCATITFTAVRPDVAQAMKGEQITKATAPIVARVTMPLEVAAGLRDLLNRMIQTSPMPMGSNLTQ